VQSLADMAAHLVTALAIAALRVGDAAPDFAVQSHTGATVTLKGFAGQKVLLWFYPRASTGG